MNDIRKIIISNGWEPDQNNALAEVFIPSTIETLNAPRKVTFLGQTLNYIPSTAAALKEFVAPNMTSLTLTSSCKFSGFSSVTTLSFPNLETLRDVVGQNSGGLNSMSSLTSLSLPKLKTLVLSYKAILFQATPLTTLYLPELESIAPNGPSDTCYVFNAINSLNTVSLPKLSRVTTNTVYAFFSCTGLTNVALGSEGNPVISLGNNTFNGCTQSGLTITIYTTGGAALSGSPWGATNATIVYEEA